MAFTEQDKEELYQYFASRGMGIASLPDGGGDLANKYLAPVLEYASGGTAARLVRLAVSALKGEKGDKGAPGETPIFRTGSNGIEWKYLSEQDTAYRPLVLIDVLKLKFADLTPEQMQTLWENIPADVVALFQSPATEAATDARTAITDLLNLEATVQGNEEARETFYSSSQTLVQGWSSEEAARAAAEAERVKGEQSRCESETKRAEAENSRTLAETARETAESKRATDEQLRKTAEEARQTNEATRQAQELLREKNTNQAISNAEKATRAANTAADRANTAAAAAEGVVDGIRPDWLAGKDSANYIKNKPEVPTLSALPTAQTLTYVNTDGTTVSFRIGDEVRVSDEGEYVFYKLYDLAEGVASWQESGSGVALPGNLYLQGANYYNESVTIIKEGYIQ